MSEKDIFDVSDESENSAEEDAYDESFEDDDLDGEHSQKTSSSPHMTQPKLSAVDENDACFQEKSLTPRKSGKLQKSPTNARTSSQKVGPSSILEDNVSVKICSDRETISSPIDCRRYDDLPRSDSRLSDVNSNALDFPTRSLKIQAVSPTPKPSFLLSPKSKPKSPLQSFKMTPEPSGDVNLYSYLNGSESKDSEIDLGNKSLFDETPQEKAARMEKLIDHLIPRKNAGGQVPKKANGAVPEVSGLKAEFRRKVRADMETKAAKESELQHARKPTVQFEDQFPPAPRDKFSNESSKDVHKLQTELKFREDRLSKVIDHNMMLSSHCDNLKEEVSTLRDQVAQLHSRLQAPLQQHAAQKKKKKKSAREKDSRAYDELLQHHEELLEAFDNAKARESALLEAIHELSQQNEDLIAKLKASMQREMELRSKKVAAIHSAVLGMGMGIGALDDMSPSHNNPDDDSPQQRAFERRSNAPALAHARHEEAAPSMARQRMKSDSDLVVKRSDRSHDVGGLPALREERIKRDMQDKGKPYRKAR